MFEMFATILVAVATALFGLSRFVVMTGEHIEWYCLGIACFIVALYALHRFHKLVRSFHIYNLHIDEQDYIYYLKYTSPLYRIGYFLSYLIQNILFDYTYMRRNFNFCKGLDVYDGGVGEYYVKFRTTWYQYLKLTRKRHKVSLKKLQAYAQTQKNHMILEAIDKPEEREIYEAFTHAAEEYFAAHHQMTRYLIRTLPDYKKVHPYYRKNLLHYYKALMYINRYEPDLIEFVNRMNDRAQRNITDFKKMDFKK